MAYWNSWTLDAGVGRWTLDSGLWTFDATLWMLRSGHWALPLTVSEQNQDPVSDSAWLNTPLQTFVTCTIIYTLRHRKIFCARRNERKQLQRGKCRTTGYGRNNKTSIRLQPSKSRKRSLTCAVTGCTNNEYNIEVWRDSLCEIHQGIFLFLEIIPDNSFSSK